MSAGYGRDSASAAVSRGRPSAAIEGAAARVGGQSPADFHADGGSAATAEVADGLACCFPTDHGSLALRHTHAGR
jgi:hypothetical protein